LPLAFWEIAGFNQDHGVGFDSISLGHGRAYGCRHFVNINVALATLYSKTMTSSFQVRSHLSKKRPPELKRKAGVTRFGQPAQYLADNNLRPRMIIRSFSRPAMKKLPIF